VRLIGKGPDASRPEPSVQGHPVVVVCGRAGRCAGPHVRGDSPRPSHGVAVIAEATAPAGGDGSPA